MIFLQIYTMEITLGVFAFLLLLGVIAILAFLGIYRLNDARAYARYVALKYITYNYTHKYHSPMCVDIDISLRICFRFQNQKDNVKFAQNQNNLYKSPVSTFQNPMYGKAVLN